jgi:hypothetical protein
VIAASAVLRDAVEPTAGIVPSDCLLRYF